MSDASEQYADHSFGNEQEFAAKLMERFRPAFLEKVARTVCLGAAYLDAPTAEHRAAIQDCTHRLAGIAGALGRADISAEAGQVDVALEAGAPEADDQLASLLKTLEAALQTDE